MKENQGCGFVSHMCYLQSHSWMRLDSEFIDGREEELNFWDVGLSNSPQLMREEFTPWD